MTLRNKLQKLENRGALVLTFSDYDEDAGYLIELLGWKNLARQHEIEKACSKRSDSGERCEVKKGMKSRGGLGREVPLSPSLAFIFSRSFYFAPLPTI